MPLIEVDLTGLSSLLIKYPNAGLERPWESIKRGTAERLIEVAKRVIEIVEEKIYLK